MKLKENCTRTNGSYAKQHNLSRISQIHGDKSKQKKNRQNFKIYIVFKRNIRREKINK